MNESSVTDDARSGVLGCFLNEAARNEGAKIKKCDDASNRLQIQILYLPLSKGHHSLYNNVISHCVSPLPTV